LSQSVIRCVVSRGGACSMAVNKPNQSIDFFFPLYPAHTLRIRELRIQKVGEANFIL